MAKKASDTVTEAPADIADLVARIDKLELKIVQQLTRVQLELDDLWRKFGLPPKRRQAELHQQSITRPAHLNPDALVPPITSKPYRP
jgi:hypothetical protein